MPNAKPAVLRGGVTANRYVTSDPLLLPRVEAYARGGDGDVGGERALRDVDGVVAHLRARYRQYARKPVLPFKRAVERAIAEAKTRGRLGDVARDGEEDKFGRMTGEGSSDHEGSESTSESGSDGVLSSSSSEEEEGADAAVDAAEGRARLDGEPAEAKPAFAAPDVVAAAAQRALKLEEEAKAMNSSKAGKEEESSHERAMRSVAEARSRGAAVKLTERGMKIERANANKDKKRGKKGKGHRRKRGGNDSESESLDEDAFGSRKDSFAQMTSPRAVKLSDLGGIEDSLHAIKELIICPLMHPELYAWLGVDPPRGVLLHGPPGCGKTTLAHAIAQEAKVPFFSIAATEIVSGMSGESEAKIRELFQTAAAHAPSLIFIDEIDAIGASTQSANDHEMERRIVAQLLASMDELQSTVVGTDEVDRLARCRRHVTVIGATNRPDGMDAALRRWSIRPRNHARHSRRSRARAHPARSGDETSSER